ncbi:hypothetical protein [Streptomyces narbonensis]|uniref:hypothetical protein n=1 Tax=Streptomyces narbonensis TaxID=67333 RepID=UPI0016789FDE|nr:hypothetical protein [Streptomyces narbonensis]GGW00237.1 hypothetical protein GCM10010230_27860 [Streptomyces narbonensis]
MTTTPPPEDRRTTTEIRLRAALTARAAQITPRDLRREDPPRGRTRTVRALRAPALAALAAAAAVAAVCLLYLFPGSTPAPIPVQPARPPGISDPAPPTPGPVSPSPGPTIPSPVVTPRAADPAN